MMKKLCVLAAVLLLIPLLSYSAEERQIAIFPEYSGIAVQPGETVKMDLVIENKGKSDELVYVRPTSVPEGFRLRLKGGNYLVSGLYVPKEKTKNLSLTIESRKIVPPGVYTFGFEAYTEDEKLTSSCSLSIFVRKEALGLEDIAITTSYPVLKGQTDATYEFSIEVFNKSERDRTINLQALGPEKWEITFKPAYEYGKQISSINIKADESKTITVEVKPPKDAKPGEYPILVRASVGEKKAEAPLLVILTGTYSIEAGTPTGLLSLEAMPGRESRVSLFVKNTGSAPQKNVTFTSFKPENWEVKFEPERIDLLEPGRLKQVDVKIKPAKEALVGDYSVNVSVDGEKANRSVEFRVTVKASTAWIWVGIGIILFVIAGLTALFVWLGRR
jgi:uncharacterized membrane protein